MFKSLFLRLVVGSILFSAFSVWAAQTAVEAHGNLTTQGGYLLDKNGKIVQLRGMSFYWSTTTWPGYKYYNAATVDLLVDTYKCTVLRDAYDRNNGNNSGGDGVQTVIDEAIKKGVYVIIDWHSHTAQNQQADAVSYFTSMAQKYKNTPNVIFEPYNEPITSDGSKDGSLTTAQKTWAAIKPYLKAVTKAIRNAGADNLVILGTPYYAQYVNVAANDQVKDDNGNVFKNVAYSFHFYAASHGPQAYYVTHDNPTGAGGQEADFIGSAKGKIPIFITEWGTTNADGGEKYTYVDEANTNWWFKNYVNGEYHFSWCNWSVSDFQPSSLWSGGSTSTLSQSGTIVKRLLTSETTDIYGMPADTGYQGPAKDSVFTMPATHPAASFNRYFSALVTAGNVLYAERDNVDVRTAKNTCLIVSPGVAADYVTYYINSTTATKNIILRYLATAGTGTIDYYLDGTKIGTSTIKTNSKWFSDITPLSVPAGNHKLKFVFTNAANSGYKLEWFELTNDSTPVLMPSQHKSYSASTNISMINKGFTIDFPVSHGYSYYALAGVDGRIVKNGALTSSTSQLKFNDLSSGTWLLKLNGITGTKTYKVVVKGL